MIARHHKGPTVAPNLAIEGFTLSCYLRLVDATGPMIRAGKASLEADMAPIFHRLGFD